MVNGRLRSALQVDLPLHSQFGKPTIAELAAEVKTLRTGGSSVSRSPLQKRNSIDPLLLSFSQLRLWFLEKMEGEHTAYNMHSAWRLEGHLNNEALRQALQALVHRYEVLRTIFVQVDGEPLQKIRPLEKFELPIISLPENEVAEYLRLESGKAFDLSHDYMLRASLLKLQNEDHILALTLHHIACDGWSLQILWQELSSLYNAFGSDTKASLPTLEIQYADYALWQRKELQGQRLETLLQYWRDQLQDLEWLELPTDKTRPPTLTYRGSQIEFQIPETLLTRLKSLALKEGVTLHMLMLANFLVLLYRYSGQEDIAVGTPSAGRNHDALEQQIGFFVNTLVLRTNLSQEPTFRELLGRVRQVSLDAYDHQDLPF